MKKAILYAKGFTLIELLVVIAVLGILVTGSLIIIDPLNKIKEAKDTTIQNNISVIAEAAERYTVNHQDFYPSAIQDLVSDGELKSYPITPSGYNGSYMIGLPSGCDVSDTCTDIIVIGYINSKKYSSQNLIMWRYESATGKSCAVQSEATSCP